jgi:hypothetical protein
MARWFNYTNWNEIMAKLICWKISSESSSAMMRNLAKIKTYPESHKEIRQPANEGKTTTDITKPVVKTTGNSNQLLVDKQLTLQPMSLPLDMLT